ncbi:putative Ubiquitin fusion degradation protein 1-like protein [Cardiosporidium cionae]|uniref:Ubiquitin fusion degradation protein 1-like protein n=1 Tax=Cardiosporidium cionae TaxID=476202 RepID=A0ABQ7JEB1_9APIC|nr:putative Ubiquitin fusion degradation protein 1-like protein [Cardiosporidium cionae]|eukprot:KAF8822352.1 putative Ubiquitin fusion degradation protein 1-like protein [Cardiosporidium cionae]
MDRDFEQAERRFHQKQQNARATAAAMRATLSPRRSQTSLDSFAENIESESRLDDSQGDDSDAGDVLIRDTSSAITLPIYQRRLLVVEEDLYKITGTKNQKNVSQDNADIEHTHEISTDDVNLSSIATRERLPQQMLSADKIILPSSVLEQLNSSALENKISYPLCFELFCPKTQRYTHAGVLEFTAIEDTTVLPKKVSFCLGILEMDPTDPWDIVLTYKNLPKGKFAAFEVMTKLSIPILRQEAALENALRLYHTTLTVGDTIKLDSMIFKVQKLEPANAVSVIDTELSVDVIPHPRSKSQTENAKDPSEMEKFFEIEEVSFQKVEFGSITSGQIIEDELTVLRLFIPQDILNLVKTERYYISISLTSDPPDGADLFASIPPLVTASPHVHHFADFSYGLKVLKLDSEMILQALHSHQSRSVSYIFCEHNNRSLSAGSAEIEWPDRIMIGVVGSSISASFNVEASVASKSLFRSMEVTPADVCDTTSDLSNAGGKQCTNCKKSISLSSYDIHCAFCHRFCSICKICGIVVKRKEFDRHWHCPKCSLSMDKSSSEKHLKTWHTPIPCACGISVERTELQNHRTLECPKRVVLCQFCGNYVAAGSNAKNNYRDKIKGYTAHESYCGSRTTLCDRCNKYVQLKDLTIHFEAVHNISNTQFPRLENQESCLVCNKSNFKNLYDWLSHFESHFSENHISPDDALHCSNIVCNKLIASQSLSAESRIPEVNIPETANCLSRKENLEERDLRAEKDITSNKYISPTSVSDVLLCENCALLIGTSRPKPPLLLQRYFLQLMTGCGRKLCRNIRACRTANSEAMDRTTAAVRALEFSKMKTLYLCVL